MPIEDIDLEFDFVTEAHRRLWRAYDQATSPHHAVRRRAQRGC